MAKTATLTETLKVTGDGETDSYVEPTFTNSNSPGQSVPVSLASGDNTLSAPASPVARGLIIKPPDGSGVALTLKGNAADTGIGLAPDQETRLMFPAAGPGVVIINAGSAVVITLKWF